MNHELKKVKLNKYNNDWFRPGSTLKIAIWHLISRLFFQTTIPYPSSLKSFLLRLFGANLGKKIVFKQRITIKYPWLLQIGDFSWIGEGVWIDNLAQISIGSNVCISQNAYLLTGNHNFTKAAFDLIVKEIHLEEGVWIGANATVCPGITCHSHSVLSVGSVATSNLEPYSIYQGIPAQFKNKRELL